MNIHLIEHANQFKRLQDKTWESGWWNLNEDTVKKLVGGEVYFHRKKEETFFTVWIIKGYKSSRMESIRGK